MTSIFRFIQRNPIVTSILAGSVSYWGVDKTKEVAFNTVTGAFLGAIIGIGIAFIIKKAAKQYDPNCTVCRKDLVFSTGLFSFIFSGFLNFITRGYINYTNITPPSLTGVTTGIIVGNWLAEPTEIKKTCEETKVATT